ncbi:diphosphomevalonate decarboxylase, partial [Flavobacterium sp. HJSW_4]
MYSAADFIPNPYTSTIENGNFEWSAPSNIALVKYWGKKDNQIPANPSVSFTLNNCKTITKLAFEKRDTSTPLSETNSFSFDLLFEGKPKEDFKPKIQKFLERIE